MKLHVFVCPEEKHHIAQLRRLLSRRYFAVRQVSFDYTRAKLIRLGKKTDSRITRKYYVTERQR